ncbi:helix-turn-helix transcriptional regulator [Rhizobium sp. B230/85]|uniref:helix-turn-helix transcriptional regulator n=1 Tax=unclassified Rhizobium TaxID=2613769 RepID=UPI001ADCB891|nr:MULTISPECIES: helix-turn-helix transcriptional regulator [unclassified Rhizobium]MBO9135038.1 helix-turn-helix transcriptional regulator [Rhizobium sp. B209b/85]QXZ98045.1 helix-turn-helix transcriptional regulator [Rhizobium sp. B230/85]
MSIDLADLRCYVPARERNMANNPKFPKKQHALVGTDNVQDLARRLAAGEASADVIKRINESMAAHSSIIKTISSAGEIAKVLSQISETGKIMERFKVSLPKVDLKLPDPSQRIQASLPRPLDDLPSYIPPTMTDACPDVPHSNLSSASKKATQINTPGDLGQMIRRARETRRLSQQAFADLAGVGRRFISELENGKATLEFDKVLTVLRAAGISMFARNR